MNAWGDPTHHPKQHSDPTSCFATMQTDRPTDQQIQPRQMFSNRSILLAMLIQRRAKNESSLPSCTFKVLIFLLCSVEKANMHQQHKFHQNRYRGFWDIAIFFVFHGNHFDFQNSQILLAGGVWRAEMHHRAKFRQNLPIHCGVMAIFKKIFKMAAVCNLGFLWGIFGPPTNGTWWSLSPCKIWLQLMQ